MGEFDAGVARQAAELAWDEGGAEPVVVYFGDPWDLQTASCMAQQTPTPVGRPCSFCGYGIAAGSKGFMAGCLRLGPPPERAAVASVEPIHRECRTRSVAGSMEHLEGRCSCYGGPRGHGGGGATALERYTEAVRVWARTTGGDGDAVLEGLHDPA